MESLGQPGRAAPSRRGEGEGSDTAGGEPQRINSGFAVGIPRAGCGDYTPPMWGASTHPTREVGGGRPHTHHSSAQKNSCGKKTLT